MDINTIENSLLRIAGEVQSLLQIIQQCKQLSPPTPEVMNNIVENNNKVSSEITQLLDEIQTTQPEQPIVQDEIMENQVTIQEEIKSIPEPELVSYLRTPTWWSGLSKKPKLSALETYTRPKVVSSHLLTTPRIYFEIEKSIGYFEVQDTGIIIYSSHKTIAKRLRSLLDEIHSNIQETPIIPVTEVKSILQEEIKVEESISLQTQEQFNVQNEVKEEPQVLSRVKSDLKIEIPEPEIENIPVLVSSTTSSVDQQNDEIIQEVETIIEDNKEENIIDEVIVQEEVIQEVETIIEDNKEGTIIEKVIQEQQELNDEVIKEMNIEEQLSETIVEEGKQEEVVVEEEEEELDLDMVEIDKTKYLMDKNFNIYDMDEEGYAVKIGMYKNNKIILY